jgi:hypothetical protein
MKRAFEDPVEETRNVAARLADDIEAIDQSIAIPSELWQQLILPRVSDADREAFGLANKRTRAVGAQAAVTGDRAVALRRIETGYEALCNVVFSHPVGGRPTLMAYRARDALRDMQNILSTAILWTEDAQNRYDQALIATDIRYRAFRRRMPNYPRFRGQVGILNQMSVMLADMGEPQYVDPLSAAEVARHTPEEQEQLPYLSLSELPGSVPHDGMDATPLVRTRAKLREIEYFLQHFFWRAVYAEGTLVARLKANAGITVLAAHVADVTSDPLYMNSPHGVSERKSIFGTTLFTLERRNEQRDTTVTMDGLTLSEGLRSNLMSTAAMANCMPIKTQPKLSRRVVLSVGLADSIFQLLMRPTISTRFIRDEDYVVTRRVGAAGGEMEIFRDSKFRLPLATADSPIYGIMLEEQQGPLHVPYAHHSVLRFRIGGNIAPVTYTVTILRDDRGSGVRFTETFQCAYDPLQGTMTVEQSFIVNTVEDPLHDLAPRVFRASALDGHQVTVRGPKPDDVTQTPHVVYLLNSLPTHAMIEEYHRPIIANDGTYRDPAFQHLMPVHLSALARYFEKHVLPTLNLATSRPWTNPRQPVAQPRFVLYAHGAQ